MKKEDEYVMKIVSQISKLFDEDCENYIDMDEFAEDENMTDFTHAISTLAPAVIVNKLTGNNFDMLSFNHMANRLVAQYMKHSGD